MSNALLPLCPCDFREEHGDCLFLPRGGVLTSPLGLRAVQARDFLPRRAQ
jgi:hypothetical protein